MQVYRNMNIGTAKPPSFLLDSLPHHLVDCISPDQQFCAGDFVRESDRLCTEISARGRLPVILGGTAFYIKNFVYGLPDTPQSDPGIRESLLKRLDIEGLDPLREELSGVDSLSASRIHPHDAYRIVRSLEIFYASGHPQSSFEAGATLREGYSFVCIALDRPRAEVYERIEKRVDEMFDAGLVDEFNGLLEAGYGPDDPGMQAIGYREFFLTDPPASDIPLIRDAIVRNSKKYAKRQETFIRSMKGIHHVHAEDFSGVAALIKTALDGLL